MSGPGLFCEHKKLRTTCPACKPAPAPEAPRAPAAPNRPSTGARPAPKAKAGEDDEKESKRSGGVAMLPKRRTKNRVTAADEAKAEAWWVKK